MRLVKIKLTCSECGSTALSFDANAEWNYKRQKYDYYIGYDCYCNECEHSGDPHEEVILNQKLLNINVL